MRRVSGSILGMVLPEAALFSAVDEDVCRMDERQQSEKNKTDVHLEQIQTKVCIHMSTANARKVY